MEKGEGMMEGVTEWRMNRQSVGCMGRKGNELNEIRTTRWKNRGGIKGGGLKIGKEATKIEP